MPTSSRPDPPTFGEDRIRRLRIVIGVLAATASAGLLLAAYTAIAGDDDALSSAIVLAVISAILVGLSVPTWLALARSTPTVRRAAAGCGALALASALPTAGLILGFIWAVVGLAILFLSLAADEP